MENPAYYLDDHVDEVLPHGLESLSLEGWAKWLANGGDAEWPADVPADGQEFTASSTTFDADIVAEMSEDGHTIVFSRPPNGYTFAAVRFGPGMGWSPDDILDPDGIEADLLGRGSWRDEPVLQPSEDCLIAVGHHASLRLRYKSNGPAFEIIGTAQ
jgi:hypothetical protein